MLCNTQATGMLLLRWSILHDGPHYTDLPYPQSEKLVKQQYLLHMSTQYYGDELQPTNGWDRLVSFGHPSKSQRVSRVGFVTAPTSLNSQLNFARCFGRLLGW